ncbi:MULTISPECIES: ABC transporter permease [Geobacillus]|jgi:putative spermidine/putrescine transport system permease protein|uniref:ABC transporter (Permease) n=2 Tax=Geobacillus TaxID=129337 RepID=A4ITB3_GEOTN|nr:MULTISPECIES: ABC transporter permease [Geobacillus]ABO68567.1 ABC transporter (permease) [Geobacillus thermodenitrificans NG80-2]ATO37701.1 ABC transporter permease [Geobacillus thermodenitrificans]NNU88773.1 ABC transporter permease [Geobacillus sp. MR]PTR46286.1 ABC transporter permease [Geobacillus thermodenitrificans]QNU32720.1 ABC transporter permease [Geobacillus sp. 47C-IIb]
MKKRLYNFIFHSFCFVVYVFLLAPIIVVLLSSLTTTEYIVFPPKGITLKWYIELVNHPEFTQSFVLSVIVALGTSLFSTFIGTLASIAIVRYQFKGKATIVQLVGSPLLIPSVVFGVALLQFYSWIGLATSPMALIIGHIILTVPFVVRLVVASLVGFDRSIEQAARSLGAGAFKVFFQITLPIIKSGVIAGAIFSFITSFDDLTVALFIVSTDVVTLPVRIFTYMQYQYDPIITSVSSIIILFTVVLMVIIEKVLGVGKVFMSKN